MVKFQVRNTRSLFTILHVYTFFFYRLLLTSTKSLCVMKRNNKPVQTVNKSDLKQEL